MPGQHTSSSRTQRRNGSPAPPTFHSCPPIGRGRTRTRPAGGCSNSSIVNLLLYGWFITKWFPAELPSWRGVCVDDSPWAPLNSLPPSRRTRWRGWPPSGLPDWANFFPAQSGNPGHRSVAVAMATTGVPRISWLSVCVEGGGGDG